MQKQSLKKVLNADDPSACYVLGRHYNRTGGYWHASEILGRLVELTPDDALANYQLGVANLQQFSRRKEAIENFRKAVDICPQMVRAYRFRTNIHCFPKVLNG